jgi:hypothetical protein
VLPHDFIHLPATRFLYLPLSVASAEALVTTVAHYVPPHAAERVAGDVGLLLHHLICSTSDEVDELPFSPAFVRYFSDTIEPAFILDIAHREGLVERFTVCGNLWYRRPAGESGWHRVAGLTTYLRNLRLTSN